MKRDDKNEKKAICCFQPKPPGESDAASSRRLFLLSAKNSIILDFMLNIGALVQVLRNFRLVAL